MLLSAVISDLWKYKPIARSRQKFGTRLIHWLANDTVFSFRFHKPRAILLAVTCRHVLTHKSVVLSKMSPVSFLTWPFILQGESKECERFKLFFILKTC
jgi:hypothetical protein